MKYSIVIIFILSFISCDQSSKKDSVDNGPVKFDKMKWQTKTDREYPYRDQMVNDLIADKKLTGIKKDSILNLLGPPGRTDTNYLFYIVSQSYVADLLPLHTKSLVIKFAGDSTVEWVKIHE